MRQKLAAIRKVLEGLKRNIDDPEAQKMLRYMLMALTGLELWVQYGGSF